MSNNIFFNLIWFILFLPSNSTSQSVPVNYLQTAESFLAAIKNKEEVVNYIKTFEKANEDQLANQLATDDQKLAFWINIYNAFIQTILSADPTKYEDRGNFFKNKQINIAGTMLSFADIEHGIIRRSQNELFLGYLSRWFVNKFEKKFRVSKRNYRIHFALNCGAKSCPPVAIYDWTRISEQLEKSKQKFLLDFTEVNHAEKTAFVTSLFSWFRGDFGGIEGIKDILLEQKLIQDRDYKLKIENYDWTLFLNNFIEL